jgi:hypothetical protein
MIGMDTIEIPLYDVYDIWYKPFWYSWWFLTLLGVIFLLLGALFVLLWYKKTEKALKLREPWRETLQQLNALEVEKYQNPETHKAFYNALLLILKKYVSFRYRLPLQGKTEAEMIQEMQNAGIDTVLVEQFSSIMQGAVIIKFSDQASACEHMRHDVMRSIDFVKGTMPHKK